MEGTNEYKGACFAFENLLEPEKVYGKVAYKKARCTGGWRGG
jgi:hypothetical protein